MKKTVLITGGTRGIGKELAIKFAKMNYNVAITYFNSDNLASELNNFYGVYAIKADVSNYNLAKAVIDSVVSKFGGIDILINNAAVAPKQKPLFDVSDSEFYSVINVNLLGVFNYSKTAINYMLSSGGVICNISSIQGIEGGSCEVAYATSKAGVIGFTRALASELENGNISVFAVAPTLTDTDMNAHLTIEEKLEFLLSQNVKTIPTARGVAEDIYNLILNAKNYHGKTVNLTNFSK